MYLSLFLHSLLTSYKENELDCHNKCECVGFGRSLRSGEVWRSSLSAVRVVMTVPSVLSSQLFVFSDAGWLGIEINTHTSKYLIQQGVVHSSG